MDAMRSPIGGMVVGNLYYRGGMTLPKEATAQPPARKSKNTEPSGGDLASILHELIRVMKPKNDSDGGDDA